ncbi:hypothetical protein, partial [Candidatus Magnetaquicoccus inordinatus]|uniref:hypothetical protein n=1 Tax=Candidatus Magnetaquicoccus inordinatus TaxID=2496818 RepID=UPI00102B2D4A
MSTDIETFMADLDRDGVVPYLDEEGQPRISTRNKIPESTLAEMKARRDEIKTWLLYKPFRRQLTEKEITC